MAKQFLISTISSIFAAFFALWWFFYDGEHHDQWKLIINASVAVFAVATFVKFYWFSDKPTQFRFITSPGIPFIKNADYYERTNDERRIYNEIDKHKTKVFFVTGEVGVGKSTIVSQILARNQPKTCDIVVIWLNCLKWRDNFDDKAKFDDQLLEKVNQVGVTKKCFEITSIRSHFQSNTLLILDDLLNVDLFNYLLKTNQFTQICVITHDTTIFPVKNRRKLFKIERLSELKVEDLLANFYGLLKNNDQQPVRFVRELAMRNCAINLPIVVEMIAASVSNQPELSGINDDQPIFRLIRLILRQLPEKKQEFLFTFLFFDPGDLISQEDLLHLWGQDWKNTLEIFLNLKIIRQLYAQNQDKLPQFFLHQLVWEAIFEVASRDWGVSHLKTRGLEQIRCRISLKLAQVSPTFANKKRSEFRYIYEHEKWRYNLVHGGQCSKLMLAIIDGRLNAVKQALLLEKPLETRHEALFITSRCGHLNVMIYLINNDNTCFSWLNDDDADTLLHPAALNGHIEICKFLCENEPKLAGQVNKLGQTPLYLAAMNGHLDVVTMLSELAPQTVKVAEAKNGVTPLCIAAHFGHFEVVKFLANLCPGVVRVPAKDGNETPIWVAAENGHLNVVKFLAQLAPETAQLPAKKGLAVPALFPACYNGHVEVVKFLALLAPDTVSMTSAANGASPMWLAAMNGHVETVRFLGKIARQQVTLPDNKGMTPLWIGAANGHLDTVKCLAKMSPDLIKTANLNGETPLWIAAMNGHIKVVEFLSEIAASQMVTMVDQRGGTPLLIASFKGHLDVVKFLSKLAPDTITVPDKNGATPLLMAALRGHLDVVEYLSLMSPHLVSTATLQGETPLMVAKQNGHLAVVDFLNRF